MSRERRFTLAYFGLLVVLALLWGAVTPSPSRPGEVVQAASFGSGMRGSGMR